MVDDVLLNKAATIERCVSRARAEFEADPATFSTNQTRQDAAILNIQRGCEAAIDIGNHFIFLSRLGVPQSSKDVFEILAQHHYLNGDLADRLKRMVGFRNIAIHDYQPMQLPIVMEIITHRLDDLLEFSGLMLTFPAGE